jgi:hypothetical protein
MAQPPTGLIPTIPFTDAGQWLELSVSVPTATTHKDSLKPVPDPALEPQGL